MTPRDAIYNKVSVRSDADKTTERLKMQSLGCFAYDAEVSAVLIIWTTETGSEPETRGCVLCRQQ